MHAVKLWVVAIGVEAKISELVKSKYFFRGGCAKQVLPCARRTICKLWMGDLVTPPAQDLTVSDYLLVVFFVVLAGLFLLLESWFSLLLLPPTGYDISPPQHLTCVFQLLPCSELEVSTLFWDLGLCLSRSHSCSELTTGHAP